MSPLLMAGRIPGGQERTSRAMASVASIRRNPSKHLLLVTGIPRLSATSLLARP